MTLHCDEVMERFVSMCQGVMGKNLVGVYLHGSLAMGCFNPGKSDLDLLVVVEEDLEKSEEMQFMNSVVALNAECEAQGMELSIVKRAVLRPFVYPTPFLLHFSTMHLQWFKDAPEDYLDRMKGVDKDLAAHVTIIRSYGAVLHGEEIRQVFGEVPPEAFLDSILEDIANAREDILNQTVYITLNLCRVLAYLREGLVLSKKTGGEWGLQVVPERYRPFLRSALSSYGTDARMDHDAETASGFADFMLFAVEK